MLFRSSPLDDIGEVGTQPAPTAEFFVDLMLLLGYTHPDDGCVCYLRLDSRHHTSSLKRLAGYPAHQTVTRAFGDRLDFVQGVAWEYDHLALVHFRLCRFVAVVQG